MSTETRHRCHRFPRCKIGRWFGFPFGGRLVRCREISDKKEAFTLRFAAAKQGVDISRSLWCLAAASLCLKHGFAECARLLADLPGKMVGVSAGGNRGKGWWRESLEAAGNPGRSEEKGLLAVSRLAAVSNRGTLGGYEDEERNSGASLCADGSHGQCGGKEGVRHARRSRKSGYWYHHGV